MKHKKIERKLVERLVKEGYTMSDIVIILNSYMNETYSTTYVCDWLKKRDIKCVAQYKSTAKYDKNRMVTVLLNEEMDEALADDAVNHHILHSRDWNEE